MIHYVKGDLIKAFKAGEVTMIAHGCNCYSTMGGGIARALANEYPIIERFDSRLNLRPQQRLGRVVKVEVEPNKYILNCYTQFTYGRNKVHLDYKALKRCLKAIWYNVITNPEMANTIFGMPKIGAGLAGGDWSKIERIINKVMKLAEVYVYELE